MYHFAKTIVSCPVSKVKEGIPKETDSMFIPSWNGKFEKESKKLWKLLKFLKLCYSNILQIW